MNIWDELLEEAKYAAITTLAVGILFGMSVGIALFFSLRMTPRHFPPPWSLRVIWP